MSLISKITRIKFIFSLSHINDITKWTEISRVDRGSIMGNLFESMRNIKNKLESRINYFAFTFIDGVVSLKKDFLYELPTSIPKKNKIHIDNSMNYNPDSNFMWKKPYIVWVANIKKPKNPEVFIKLAEHYEYKNIDFLMIGQIQDDAYNYILDSNLLPK